MANPYKNVETKGNKSAKKERKRDASKKKKNGNVENLEKKLSTQSTSKVREWKKAAREQASG